MVVYIHIYTQMPMVMNLDKPICVNVRVCIPMFGTRTRQHVSIHICICMCTCICVHACMCACMYVCVYVCTDVPCMFMYVDVYILCICICVGAGMAQVMWSPDYKTPPPPPKQLRPRNNNGGGAVSLIFSCLRGPGSKLFGGRGSQ